MLGVTVHTAKKITEALVVASKENELAVNVYNTKHMVMPRDEDSGWKITVFRNVVPVWAEELE